MADIVLDKQSVPTTPASGKGIIFIDSTASILAYRDDAGLVHARSNNAAITSQASGFATDTWVTNSDLLIPSWGLQAKTLFLWTISASKTAAGTVAPIYNIRIGSARTTADTARVTLTGPAQTAIADIGTLWIIATVRNIGAAGIIQATAWWVHRGTAASNNSGVGFANDTTGHVEGASAAFDMSTLAGQYVSLSLNGGASAAWTTTQVLSQGDW